MSRNVAYRNYRALIPCCVLGVTCHGLESEFRSGTFWWMRVVPRSSRAGVAPVAAPEWAVPGTREVGRSLDAPVCSTPRNERRTVCRTRTPSRWNMPEALVGVTVRQPCCPVRGSRSVIPVPMVSTAVASARQQMTTIVAPEGRAAMCPPVRMV